MAYGTPARRRNLAGPDPRSPIALETPGESFAVPLDRDLTGLRVAWAPRLDGSIPFEPEVIAALVDGAVFSVALNLGNEVYTAWVMNPETRAMTRYTDFNFNSFATIDGVLYGAAPGGIYRLQGPDDDGMAISAAIRTGMLDFGTRKLKRIDQMYMGYASDGTLILRVQAVDAKLGEKVQYNYRMVERAVVIEGRIEVRKMMNLSSSFDHRVVDGMDAARFIQAIRKLIEVPALLFAD